MHFLDELNDEQRRAVEAGDGPVLIVAGPGTGKTKTLTARIAFLIASGFKPEEILALTFTKKAAEEMRGRVLGLLTGRRLTTDRSPVVLPHISTFHALCAELLGGEQQFIAEPARLQLIKILPKPAELKGLSARELGLKISRAKNLAEDGAALAKLVQAYDAALAEQGLMDFDDLLLMLRDRLQADETFRRQMQLRYRHILVDEFQDTNRLQYELLQLLRGNDNLFVIGDPQQSIYGFRGASGDIFARFFKGFPQAAQIVLHRNYRSAPEIVQLANAIFPDAEPLRAHVTQPGQARAIEVLNEYSEANWVLDELQRAIGGGDMLRAVSDDNAAEHRSLRDFAVLYRNRAAAVALQKAVEQSGLPYQIVGEGSPYEQPRVQTLLGCLTALQAGVPDARDAETQAVPRDLSASDPPAQLAEALIARLGLDYDAALRQFVNTLVRFETIDAALRYIEAIAAQEYYDPEADAITLLTIHASKGLEFPHVFVIAAEEGVLPGAKADEQEERRLFYVAATRAKQRLDILHARKRGGQSAEVSRFVAAIPGDVLPKQIDPNLAADQQRARKRQLKRSQQSLF